MIKVLYDFPRQFKAAENIIRREKLSFDKKFKNALIPGVGGSSSEKRPYIPDNIK